MAPVNGKSPFLCVSYSIPTHAVKRQNDKWTKLRNLTCHNFLIGHLDFSLFTPYTTWHRFFPPRFPSFSTEFRMHHQPVWNGEWLWVMTDCLDGWVILPKTPKVPSWQKARNNIILLANYTGRSELYCGKLNFFNGTYAVLKFFRVTARRERTNSSSFHPLNWTGPKKSVSLNMKTQLTYQGGWWFSW